MLKININEIIIYVTLVPIFALIVIAFIIGVAKRVKMASKYKKGAVLDDQLKDNLLEAFGKENIENVEVEMSRLTVTVKDIDLVNPEVLKQNGANNVLLVGNKVKCSFGDKATEIYNILK